MKEEAPPKEEVPEFKEPEKVKIVSHSFI